MRIARFGQRPNDRTSRTVHKVAQFSFLNVAAQLAFTSVIANDLIVLVTELAPITKNHEQTIHEVKQPRTCIAYTRLATPQSP